MSASTTPVRWPSRENAAARFAVSVDLPTPPLAARDREHASSRRRTAPGSAARPAPQARGRGLLLLGEHVEGELDALDPSSGEELAVDLLLEARPEQAARDGERNRDLDNAAADLGSPHHPEARRPSGPALGR